MTKSPADVPVPRPRRLPPYRALLAVDVRDFSGYAGSDHAELTRRIRPTVAAAFARCGLGVLEDEEIWQRVIGDCYVAAFRSSMLPALLHPLLRALQEQLDHDNRHDPVAYPPRPVRMRAAVHVGPVTDPDDDPGTDGSGDARVEVHRLLDADVLKDVLTRSGDATCVAALVSDRVHHDVVHSHYIDEPTERYRPVDVVVKGYSGRAYLRVPEPSGEALDRGLVPALVDEGAGARPDEPGPPAPARTTTIGIRRVDGDAHNVITGNSGPVTFGNTGSPHATGGGGRRRRRDG